jgi:hypothetical protein
MLLHGRSRPTGPQAGPLLIARGVSSGATNFHPKDMESSLADPSKMKRRCHVVWIDRFPAGYDFVVGAVNVASYVSRGFHDWRTGKWRKQFVVDRVHPTKFGHVVFAFLIWDLMANGDQRHIFSVPSPLSPKKVHLTCGKDTSTSSNQIQTILTEQPSLASWSAETSKNTAHSPGMIYPSLLNLSTNYNTIINETALVVRGKIDSSRSDRKNSFRLPYCSSKERLSFDLTTLLATATASSNMSDFPRQGHQLSTLQLFSGDEQSKIPHPSAYVEVEMNSFCINTTTIFAANASWVIPPKTKKKGKDDSCQIGRQMIQRSWLVFPPGETTVVSRLDFCNHKSLCNEDYTLAHLALF